VRRLAEERIRNPVIWVPSEPPLVTVRIATFNRPRLLTERAIASALAQTHQNIEVVVVGDHCEPSTEQAINRIRDPRIRFENLTEQGRYPSHPLYRWMVVGMAPMNRGLELARGQWIAPLDDDDEFTPDHVEVLLEECRERNLEFAYGIAAMEAEPGRWEQLGAWPLREGRIAHGSVLYWAGLRFIRYDLEGWRTGDGGDWNLWHRMRDAGVRMGFVEHVVCKHYAEGSVLKQARRELRADPV
jgi:glycosyltransferase involved in cell wall biosynthesis